MNAEYDFPLKAKNILNNEYHSTFFYIGKFDLSQHMIELWDKWKEIELIIYRKYKNQPNNLEKIVSYKGDKKFFAKLESEINIEDIIELWIFIKTIH